MSAEKRKGMQFLWKPGDTDGAVVSMIQYREHVIVACQYAVYRIRQKEGDDVLVEVEKILAVPSKVTDMMVEDSVEDDPYHNLGEHPI